MIAPGNSIVCNQRRHGSNLAPEGISTLEQNNLRSPQPFERHSTVITPMRHRETTCATLQVYRSASKSAPVPLSSHVSTYRSLKLKLQLYSRSVTAHKDGRGPTAIFTDHDQVCGKVTLDPSCHPTGRLSISIEGSLLYPSLNTLSEGVPDPSPTDTLKHVFLSLQTTENVSNSEASSPRFSLRQAFARRRPTLRGITLKFSSRERSHPFSFDFPQSARLDEKIPCSFTPTKGSNSYEVIYKVIVHWQPNDSLEPPSDLEVPFFLQPDVDFQCVDAFPTTSWLEVPLKSDRPFLPLRGAITVPTSMAFSRSSSIPYFVVFITTPRSLALAKEIATDATISVSLIRQVIVSERSSPPSKSPSCHDSELLRSQKRLKRMGISQFTLTIMPSRDKPLPELPVRKSFSDVQTIYKDICIGFPKRPRQLHDARCHSSLRAMAASPDGLYKAEIQLNADMLPSIDWGGIRVKYYLDVSVLFGLDNFEARTPIRIF